MDFSLTALWTQHFVIYFLYKYKCTSSKFFITQTSVALRGLAAVARRLDLQQGANIDACELASWSPVVSRRPPPHHHHPPPPTTGLLWWIRVRFLSLGGRARVCVRWARFLHKQIPTCKLDSEIRFSAIISGGIVHSGGWSARSCQISYTNPFKYSHHQHPRPMTTMAKEK